MQLSAYGLCRRKGSNERGSKPSIQHRDWSQIWEESLKDWKLLVYRLKKNLEMLKIVSWGGGADSVGVVNAIEGIVVNEKDEIIW